MPVASTFIEYYPGMEEYVEPACSREEEEADNDMGYQGSGGENT
jgi:hypothetical protein